MEKGTHEIALVHVISCQISYEKNIWFFFSSGIKKIFYDYKVNRHCILFDIFRTYLNNESINGIIFILKEL